MKNVQVNWSCLTYVISFRVNTFNVSWLRLTYGLVTLCNQDRLETFSRRS